MVFNAYGVISKWHFKLEYKLIPHAEVSFYTDLESFRLLFCIEVSFWLNVGVKTTIIVETTH